MMGGAMMKKKKAAKKAAPKKAAPKSAKKAAHRHSGGSFVGELSQLAIPLGLIAAKEGVAAYYGKSKKSSSKSSVSGSKKKASKSSATRRRAIFGGDATQEGSMALPMPSASANSMSLAPLTLAAPVQSAMMPANSMSMSMPTGATNAPPMSGGAAAAERHALVAREFRRMAAEISEFLNGKARGARGAKMSPKARPPKKAAAPKKKAAAKK